ncbi:MAG: phage tail protein I [Campylobacteraceae bacterium]
MKTILPKHRPLREKTLDILSASRFEGIDIKSLNTLALECPKVLLPHLANSFNVDINGLDENESRELIFDAFKIHFFSGTPYSLKVALRSVFENTTIKEWFEYGGEPYYFNVDIDSTKGVSQNTYKRIDKTIDKYKNVRSVLESVRIFAQTKGEFFVGSATLSAEACTIYPYQPKDLSLSATSQIAINTQSSEIIKILPRRG